MSAKPNVVLALEQILRDGYRIVGFVVARQDVGMAVVWEGLDDKLTALRKEELLRVLSGHTEFLPPQKLERPS